MHQQIAQLEHRIVQIVPEYGLTKVLNENPADRAATVEHSAIVARAGP